MKRAFEVDAIINRPMAEVWDELTDWKQAPRWMPGVESMTAPDGTRVGATLVFTSRGKTRTSDIEALDPGRSITLLSKQGPVTARYVYSLQPEGDRTRVSLTADIGVKGFPLTLLAPMLRAVVRRTDSRQPAKLKEVVETR